MALRIKVDGSGSTQPKLLDSVNNPNDFGVPGWRPADDWVAPCIPDEETGEGGVNFASVNAGYPVWDGSRIHTTSGAMTLQEFFELHNIPQADQAYFRQQLNDAWNAAMETQEGQADAAYVNCRPWWNARCACVKRGTGGKLPVVGRTLRLRVRPSFYGVGIYIKPIPASVRIELAEINAETTEAYYAAFVDIWPLATQNDDGTLHYRPDTGAWPPWPKDEKVVLDQLETHYEIASTVLQSYNGDDVGTFHVGDLAAFFRTGRDASGRSLSPSTGSDYGPATSFAEALSKIVAVSGLSSYALAAHFPDPNEVGKPWRAGRYFDTAGHLVVISTDSSAEILDATAAPIDGAVVMAQAGVLTVNQVSNGEIIFEGDSEWPPTGTSSGLFRGYTGTTRTVPYKIAAGEHGAISGDVYKITLTTGKKQQLPTDSYVGIAVRASEGLQLILDGKTLRPVSSASGNDGMTTYRYRISVGDLLQHADDGLADGQTLTLTLTTDGFSGRIYARNVDMAADWNRTPFLLAAGAPDFSTWEEL